MVVNTGSLLSGGQKPANAWGAPTARVIRSRAVYSSSLAAVSPRVWKETGWLFSTASIL